MAFGNATAMLPSPALTTPEDLTPEPGRRNSSSSTLSCIIVDPAAKMSGRQDELRGTSGSKSQESMRSNAPSSASTLCEGRENGKSLADALGPAGGRVRRARTGVASYNENALSAGARKAAAREKAKSGKKSTSSSSSRTPSGETLVASSGGMDVQGEQLVKASVQALDMEWDMGGLPGEELRSSLAGEGATNKKKSTRSRIKSVLGKRSRDVVEASIEKLQSMGKRARIQSQDQPAPRKGQTVRSKDRKQTQEQEKEQEETKPVPKRRSTQAKMKKFLSQALYVGQDPNYDPRLNAARNLKRQQAMADKPAIEQRKILPLPMFAGKRMLDTGRDFRMPFNIFNPLPARQPKPEEWRKTHKNVFVGDAAEFWKTTKNLEHSTCICEEDSGCDENCFNRFMFYECDSTNCNIGPEHCTNRSFEDLRRRCKAGGKYNVGVEVIKTADRGYGVRSNRCFEANQIILEYTGEIITQEECDDRMRKRYKDNECFYLMVFDQNMIIDATRGSIARFVNHACEPNCKMVKWTVAGKPRMALFAGEKGIMTGEELTYDYNFDPFSAKNIQECRCGTPSCRGVLGPRPKDKEIKDALKPLVQIGKKRKLQQAVEDTVQSLTNKKAKIAVRTSTVKKAVRTLKKATVVQLTKTKIVGSSSTKNERLVKKISERSLGKIARGQAKPHPASKVSLARRKGGASQTGEKNPTVRAAGSVKKRAAGVGRSVVRTVRGPRTGRAKAVGKSIRVVST